MSDMPEGWMHWSQERLAGYQHGTAEVEQLRVELKAAKEQAEAAKNSSQSSTGDSNAERQAQEDAIRIANQERVKAERRFADAMQFVTEMKLSEDYASWQKTHVLPSQSKKVKP